MTLKPVSANKWSLEQRAGEIDKVCAGFVAPGAANREIYRALIEHLFPPGSGLPGPVLTRQNMREAVHSIKPGYKDVFRRVRELQGEEGLHGLIKDKTKYQLQHLAIAQKREPRKAVKGSIGRKIALAQGSRCTVCGQPIVVNGDTIHVDHRVPRNRGGNSHDSQSSSALRSLQCLQVLVLQWLPVALPNLPLGISGKIQAAANATRLDPSSE